MNRRILPQQTSQIYMYTSFLSVSDNTTRLERKKLSIEGYCHNKRARYTCIPRSLSVSDNMTRLERKKLSIEGYCNNKRARYTCIPRSLSVSDNVTRLERKKLSIEGYCNNKRARYTCIPRSLRPGSDAVLHMSRIEFEFRPTQINLDRLN